MIICRWLLPVSYTHLDVYKRQIFVIDAGIPIIKISLILLPVTFIWDGEHVSLFDFFITAYT